jgi:hypothetical protein
MNHWLKRVLVTLALASGALIVTAGMAQATTYDLLDPGGVVSQTQQATNTNQTDQESNAGAETNQVNLNIPITVLSSGSGNGDVDQSNEAETEAEAENDNETNQSIDQDQVVDDGRGGGYCGKCGGSDGNVTQTQDAVNTNTTDQSANAAAETNQENVNAPESGGSFGKPEVISSSWGKGDKGYGKDGGGADVDQSNEAETEAEAENDNDTRQSVDQDQTVRDRHQDCRCDGSKDDSKDKPKHDSKDKPRHDSKDKPRHDSKDKPKHDSKDKPRGHCGCGGSDGNVTQTQDARNENGTDQEANAGAETNQQNVNGAQPNGASPVAWIDSYDKGQPVWYRDRGGDVDQSNVAETEAEAENANATGQWIDQDQSVADRDGAGYCGCGGSDGDVTQTQNAENTNSTDQTANANAVTNQSNENGASPLRKEPAGYFGGGTSGPGSGDVDQSNRAETEAEAENANATGQWIDQTQRVLRF